MADKDSESSADDEGVVGWACKRSSKNYLINPTTLIKEVKLRPALYTPDHPDRQLIPDFRKVLWNEIAQVIIKEWEKLTHWEQRDSVANLQKKWRNLKDCFRKELRLNRLRNNGERVLKRRYIYYNKLLFLKPVIASDVGPDGRSRRRPVPDKIMKSREYYAESEEDENNMNNCEEDFEVYDESIDMNNEGTMNENDTFEATANGRTDSNYVSDRELGASSQEFLVTDVMIDEDKAFALSIVPSLKRFNADQKLAAKIDILNVIRNIQSQCNSNVVIEQNNTKNVKESKRIESKTQYSRPIKDEHN